MELRNIIARIPIEKMSEFFGSATFSLISEQLSNEDSRKKAINAYYDIEDPINLLFQHEKLKVILEVLNDAELNNLSILLKDKFNLFSITDEIVSRILGSFSSKNTIVSFFGEYLPTKNDAKIVFKTNVSPTEKTKGDYSLFSHQLTVLEETKQYLFNKKKQRVMLHMPTGSGKTRTAMTLVVNMLQENPNALVVWLTNSSELSMQAADEFEKAWLKIGMQVQTVYRYFGDVEFKNFNSSGFFVSNFQKLNVSLNKDRKIISKLRRDCKLLIVDEAHIVMAETFNSISEFIINENVPTTPLLGLSATPGRTTFGSEENSDLSKFFNYKKVILEVKGYSSPIDYLLNDGYLAKIDFITDDLNIELQKLKKEKKKEFNQYKKQIILQHVLDNVKKLREEHDRIIIFADSIETAYNIATVLKLNGIWAYAITSRTDSARRKRIIKKYKDSEAITKILVNYEVLTTGFDAPKTNALIIARDTKSVKLYNQMVGRARRGIKAGGNEKATVVTMLSKYVEFFNNIIKGFMNWENDWENNV